MPTLSARVGNLARCLSPLLALLALSVAAPSLEAAAPPGEWWNASYPRRQKLTVTAGTTAVPAQYSVRLQIDHAALVTATQSQATGNDVRVVYWSGSGWVELDRRLDDQSAWNNAATRLWFRTQAPIGASSSSDDYYLYYGYAAAGAPPSDWASVFLFYDDFNDGSLDGARWSCVDPFTTSPPPSCVETGGTLSLQEDSAIWATAGYAFGVDTRWESRLHMARSLPLSGEYYDYFVATDAGVSADFYNNDWITFWANEFQQEAEASDNGNNNTVSIAVPTPTSDHVFTFDREGTNGVRFTVDGGQVHFEPAGATIPDGALRAASYNSSNDPDGVVLDWVRVRRYVTPEPAAAAAAAEVHPPPFPQGQSCVVTTAIGQGDDWGQKVALQSDGRIVVSGYFDRPAPERKDMAAVRYTSNLRLDTSFGGDGITTMDIWGDDEAEGIAVQSNGKIVLAGRSNSGGAMGCCDEVGTTRFDTDGSPDTAGYGSPFGHVSTNLGTSWDLGRAVAIQADGKIVVAGYIDDDSVVPFHYWDIGLVRYNVDGTLDTSFNPGGAYGLPPNTPGAVVTSVGPDSDYGNAVLIQPDGKIVVGAATWNGTDWDWALLRFNGDGSLDTASFNPTGAFGDAPNTPGMVAFDHRGGEDWGAAITRQTDGKIVFVGSSHSGTDLDFAVARLEANGDLDGSFGTGGVVFTPIGPGHENAESVAVQPDGRIVVAGHSSNGTDLDFAVVRYTSAGALDASFGSGGIVTTPIGPGDDQGLGVVLQPDGKILVSGNSSNGSDLDYALVRYTTTGSVDSSCGQVYRSVGTGAGNLNTGGRTVEIVADTATFSGAMPDTIGVGDVLQYQVTGTWYLAFIQGRTSDSVFSVATSTADVPQPAAAGTAVSVFRAYTSLSNWQAQDENDSLDDSAEDFDTSRDLVASGTTMMVACYDDGPMNDMVNITGWTTGPDNYVRVFTPVGRHLVGTSQRHSGVAGTGFRVTPTASGAAYQIVNLDTGYIRVEGLEIDGSGVTNARYVRGIRVRDGLPATGDIRIDSCLIHGLHTTQSGFSNEGSMGIIDMQSSAGSGPPLLITNNIIYDITNTVLHGHIAGIHVGSRGTSYAYNNTVYYINNIGNGSISGPAWGIYTKAWPAASGNATLIATNNYVGDVRAPLDPGGNRWCFDAESPGGVTTQSNNVSSDGTAVGQTLKTDYVNYFQNINGGMEDLHLKGSSALPAIWNAAGTDLSATFAHDVDGQLRSVPWDIGADEFDGTTAVTLLSFEAASGDSTVEVTWRTGSELKNLGFHVHRSLAASGPWTRITPSLIPGLGSSPVGASYSWTDTGLQNGTRYFYRLEDVDTASVSTFHGPVSAVPQAAPGGGEEEGEGSGEPPNPLPGTGSSPGGGSPAPGEPPPPGEGETPPANEPEPVCSDDGRCLYGDPGEPTLRVLSRSPLEMTVELSTPGFVASPDPAGVSVDVTGFVSPNEAQAVDLPFKRAVLDAVVGRRARLVSVEASDELSWATLRPAAVAAPGVDSRPDGTVRAVRTRIPLTSSALGVPRARLAGSAFMGHTKKLALELHPLRWDPAQGRLVLSKTLRVTIAFVGDAGPETGDGSIGRRNPRARSTVPVVFAHLHATSRGLHAVAYEDVFPRAGRPLPLSALRLVQGGRVVPVHVEPPTGTFGPGSVLYFHVDREAASTDFSSELSFALERTSGGVEMGRGSAAPLTGPLGSAPLGLARFETNRIYQSGLLQAPDLWLWEFAQSGTTKSVSLPLAGVDLASPLPVRVRVFLQGASAAGVEGEHHVSFALNGVSLGETSFEGMVPFLFEGTIPASSLLEGPNTLSFTNVGDTGVVSRVFLDRVEVEYPEASGLLAGRFSGAWTEEGVAQVALSAGARDRRGLVTGFSSVFALDVTDPASPLWLSGLEPGPGSVRMQVEPGRRYQVVTPDGLLSPRVSHPVETGLRDARNQADYILVAPRAFMDAAQPLLVRREGQGLTTFAASLEDIAQDFGGGAPSAEAIRDFLAFAYHSWQGPSPRYVLLLGDSSFDPRNFTGFDQGAPLPALWAKTSYLWTASDPAIAAVNGEDLLPDLALGRLPATNLAQAEALVQKVLDWEDGGYDLSGDAALVADNPDQAGDFEADIADIEQGFLAPRNPQSLLIRTLGGATRPAILDAMNGGLSLLSYVGHGGAAVWASENVLNSFDPPALLAQPQQPLMLTMNCLNGYFVQPNLDSLAEAFLKAEGRGTIAAFSPSGLSLDGPAHIFHRALVNQIANGNHERLGDAVLAAQQDYALSGHMPELFGVYHLLGDPALKIRQ